MFPVVSVIRFGSTSDCTVDAVICGQTLPKNSPALPAVVITGHVILVPAIGGRVAGAIPLIGGHVGIVPIIRECGIPVVRRGRDYGASRRRRLSERKRR